MHILSTLVALFLVFLLFMTGARFLLIAVQCGKVE
jgi:hypothetical protein